MGRNGKQIMQPSWWRPLGCCAFFEPRLSCVKCVLLWTQSGFLGATGKALKWQANGWAGSKGPLSNVGLWVELLGLLYPMGDRAPWIRAPAHMGFEGNKIATNLAVAGMCQSPKWEVVSGMVVRPPLVGLVRPPEQGSPSVSSCEGDMVSLSEFGVKLGGLDSLDEAKGSSGCSGSNAASGYAPG